MIELKNIIKNSPSPTGRPILEDINLKIESGEIFGIIGRSGAGKTTLLRCMNLLERPTQGEIYLNNINLMKLGAGSLRKQRQKIGYIFQHFNLLSSRTVYENIALPLELNHTPTQQLRAKVADLLNLVNLDDKAHCYPSEISGGQKQRVAIARALAADPHILLCDEATSALDSESTHSILQLLKQINEKLNLTIVLISHELDVIKKICDRVSIIDNGKLIESGSTLEIFSRPKHSATKQLVQQALHLHQPLVAKSGALLLKLTFLGNDNQPLLSNLAKKFDVTVNIVQALIETIQNTTVGFTLCELTGEQTELNSALNYIKTMNVEVEVQ